MCIAILNTKGATLKKQLLKNCWDNNGDGAGMLYINDYGMMEVFKEMKSFDVFYDKYSEVKRMYGKRNIVLHFRISTHGGITESNCHPFMVHQDLGFVHNGMIYNVPTSKVHSDTYMFNEVILQKLKEGFEYDEDILDMIEVYIGSGSKLIFLNAQDDWAIVNEKAGHWAMDCWFSNSSYKQVNDWVDYGGVKKAKTNVYGYGSYGYGTYNTKSYWADTPAADKPASKSYSLTDDNDSKMYDQCSDCGCHLYDAKEFTAGKCEWCIEEEAILAKKIYETTHEGMCECCETWANVGYLANYDAFVCSKCEDSLEKDMGDYGA
jgi:predicted glutamine amidotransferase